MKPVVGQFLSQPPQALAFLVDFAVGRMRAPADSDLAQKLETDLNAAVTLPACRVQVRPKPGDLRPGLNIRAILRQHQQLRFRTVQMPDEKFALGAQQSDREGSRAA